MKKDYYKLLNLDKNCSQDDIKKSYRNLAKLYHPDVTKGDKVLEEKFKDINEANEVLSDADKRKTYDNSGNQNSFFNIDFNDFYNYEEYFKQKTRREPLKGRNLKGTIVLTYQDIINGYNTKIKLKRDNICETCNGNGSLDKNVKKEKCAYCNGSGYIKRPFYGKDDCMACNKTGYIIKNACTTCHSTGSVLSESLIDIKIAKGIIDPVVIIKEEGGYIKDGKRGDLHLHINYNLDSNFERKGTDIYYNLNIGLIDSLFGNKMIVPTLYGNINITLNKGIENGKILRITGKGLPIYKTNIFGDQYIKINIVIPKEITEEEENVLKQLTDKKWVFGLTN